MGRKTKMVLECDKITMKIHRIWHSAVDAEKELGLGKTTIVRRCIEKRTTKGKYVYRYMDDYDPKESFEGKYHRPVLAIRIRDRQTYAFYSLDEAAEYLNVGKTHVSTAITSGKPILYDMYLVKYLR